ncbi:MAG: efflux RND transporter periplasmic adaptor subunit [PVC group bacterium]
MNILRLAGCLGALLVLLPASGELETGSESHAAEAVQEVDHWTCSMHPSVSQDRPGKCPLCGMELIPVYRESAEPAAEEQAVYGCGVKTEGHCPHCDEGKPDARCVCGGHSFSFQGKGLSQCPVCHQPLKLIAPADLKQPEALSWVKLTAQQVELGGIELAPVGKQHLFQNVRAAGVVAYDPELSVAEQEFISSLQTLDGAAAGGTDPDVRARAKDLVEKGKTRLRLFGLSEEEIARLVNERSPDQSLLLPREKMWVYASIYEYEIGWVKSGQSANVTAPAYPGESFAGEVVSLSPVVDPGTRSFKARLRVENPGLKLKPEMYVDVEIESRYLSPRGEHMVPAVPEEAVLDTGRRKIVYIQGNREGEYLGREIVAGPLAYADVEGVRTRFFPVLSGLAEGERVVTRGNFLIDSQSQLTGGMSALWGGAVEFDAETAPPKEESGPIQTQHRH